MDEFWKFCFFFWTTSIAGIFKVVNNFLFALKPNGTLYWSAVADGTTWPASNFLTFRFGDGDHGTALGKNREYALYFQDEFRQGASDQTLLLSPAP